MLHGDPQQVFQKVLQRSILCSVSPLLCFFFFGFLLVLFCCDRGSGAQSPLHLLGRIRSEAQAAPSRPKLLPHRPLIGCEGGGTLESSLLPFEPLKRGERKMNFILKLEFSELNVYFWRGRIRQAAGNKTCPRH